MKRSSLLTRLERLQAPSTSGGTVQSSAAETCAVDANPPCTPSPRASSPETAVLDQLRRRMAEVMGRASVERDQEAALGAEIGVDVEAEETSRRSGATFADLPLALREHESGPLWHRVVPVPLEYRVGARTCHDMLATSWAQVALLALEPQLVNVDPAELLFLDTETTGFGGAGTIAFLVGLAYVEDGRVVVEQLMLEGPEQEPALLAYLTALIERRPVVVSFNGKSFDWPLLQGRYTMNRLKAPARVSHLDLLHLSRRVHKQRLKRCNLQRLEAEVLGFERIGDIDGAEVAARYAHYCRTRDASHLGAVIEHNYWDVLSMVALLGVYGAAELALPAVDLAGAAATMARASALPRALLLADRAIERAAASDSDLARVSLVRAEIRKALGDKSGAVADYERAIDDPKARLELAKLYEHYLKDPERALSLVARGTSERVEASARRQRRLVRKTALD